MKEGDLALVLLVKAIEDCDSAGILLPHDERREATRAAAASEPARSEAQSDGLLIRRARLLSARLGVEEALLPAVYHSGAAALLAGAAFILGFLGSEVGDPHRLNLVSFPFVGLLAWNVLVFAMLAISTLRRRERLPRLSATMRRLLAAVAGGARLWLESAASRVPGPMKPQEHAGPMAVASQAATRFAGEWSGAAGPLLQAQIRTFFNFCAGLLALGAICGLYFQGLSEEYRAGWESTFLTAEQLHGLLRGILAPASMVTGIGIPDAEHLRAIRWGPGSEGERAASWIHLFAASVLLLVAVPRFTLAAISARRWQGLRHSVPEIGSLKAYTAAILRQVRPLHVGQSIHLCLYQYSPNAQARERLREWVGAGNEFTVRSESSIAYGAEDEFLAEVPDELLEADCVLVLFSLGATPEEETHGTLVRGLKQKLKQSQLLRVACDSSTFGNRFSSDLNDKRMAERIELWKSVGRALGVDVEVINLHERAP